MQKEFIEQLKSKSQGNTSFVEELADILDIGYDSAYRRINLRTNLSLEESVKLAKHYNVSLNKLFEVGSERTILAEISPELHNEANLEEYFIASRNNVETMAAAVSEEKEEDSVIYDSENIKDTLGEKNLDWMISNYETNTIPYHVIIKQDGTEMTFGVTFEEDEFRAFVEKGL